MKRTLEMTVRVEIGGPPSDPRTVAWHYCRLIEASPITCASSLISAAWIDAQPEAGK